MDKKYKNLHKNIFKIIIKVMVRFFLLVSFVILSEHLSFSKVYNLAILYISFLVIIINVKHKYRFQIMCQSFMLMVLGVLMYLFQVDWINTYVKAVVQLIFLIVFIELAITTLDLKEVSRILRICFGKLENDDNEIEKNIKHRKKSFNYPKGYKKR